ARRRAECEHGALDRGPRLRALDRPDRARGEGVRADPERGPAEGVPGPVTAAGTSTEESGGARVSRAGMLPADGRSALALETLRLPPSAGIALGGEDADTLLFAVAGGGLAALAGGRQLVAG